MCEDGNGTIYPGSDLGKVFMSPPGPDVSLPKPSAPLSSSDRAGWLWTAPYCYQRLNRAIIADDPTQIRPYMPLVRSLNYYIMAHGPTSTTRTFRASDSDVASYRPDTWFRFGMFVASSTAEDKAVFFYEQYKKKSILEFAIPAGCLNAGYMEPVTAFPKEHEYLLPPYTAVKCLDRGMKEFTMSNGSKKHLPWALFEVARDNKQVEDKFEKHAKMYVTTTYYRLLKESEQAQPPQEGQVSQVLARFVQEDGYYGLSAAREIAHDHGYGNVAGTLAALMYCWGSAGVMDEGIVKRPCKRFYEFADQAFRKDSGDLCLLKPWWVAFLGYLQNYQYSGTIGKLYRDDFLVRHAKSAKVGECFVLSEGFQPCFDLVYGMTAAEKFARESQVTWKVFAEIQVHGRAPWNPGKVPLGAVCGQHDFWGEGDVVLPPYSIVRLVKPPEPMGGVAEFKVFLEILPEDEAGGHILNALAVVNA